MFTSGIRQQKRTCRPSRQLLILEVLEDRTLLSTSPTIGLVPNGLTGNANPYISTDILVQFQGTPGTKGGPAIVAGTTLGTQLTLEAGYYVVNLNPGMSVAKALAEYTAEKGVLAATPDYEVSDSMVPNDPDFGKQWALNNTGQNGGLPGKIGGTPGDDIGAEQAWDVTTGNRNIVVAVVDSGVDYDHPDLAENIWINQADIPDSWYTKSSASSGYDKIVYKSEIQTATPGVITMADLNNPVNAGLVWKSDGDSLVDGGDLLRPLSQGGWMQSGKGNDLIGKNFVDSPPDNPLDGNGHGTHVAGIIGASGNNGIGVAGIDWNVQIMPVKVLSASGSGAWSGAIEGINYAIEHGANIINLSLGPQNGDVGPRTAFYDAFLAAEEHGVIIVPAAGNDNRNLDTKPQYPASLSTSLNNVVSVAATYSNNQKTTFSSYGAESVDLAAPGSEITSTWIDNRYNTISGTSMAAPQVSGALALVWGLHPDWSYNRVIDAVLSTTQKVPSLQGLVKTGGVLDLAAAVRYGQVAVGDSSFESPALAAGSHQYNPSGSPWTFSGYSGIESNGSAFGAANAPDGTQAAFLQSYITGAAGQISQAVDMTPGTYSISFWAAQRQGFGINPIQVQVDGHNVGSPISPTSTSWAPYQTDTFTITSAGLHTIKFIATAPNNGDYDSFLDEVGIITEPPISDSSFESPALAAGSHQYNPAGSPWTFSGNSGIESNGSTFGAANAPDGTQAAFLQGPSNAFLTGIRAAGQISQTVEMSPGTYSIAFSAAQRPGFPVDPIQVQIDGQNVGNPISPTSTSWASYQTAAFTITSAGLHTIKFVAIAPTTLNGDYVSFIDKVSLVDPLQAAPSNLSSSSNTVGTAQEGSTSSGGLGNDDNLLSANGLGAAGSNNMAPVSGQTNDLPQSNSSTLRFSAVGENSNPSNLTNIPSPLSVTDNSEYGNRLYDRSGLDWFWATYAGGSLNAKPTDLRN